MKLDSFEGVDRGATKVTTFGSNLRPVPPPRLKDAHTRAEWNARGFFPVLSRDGTADDRLQTSLLYKFAELGAHQNAAGFSLEGIAPLLAHSRELGGRTCPADVREFSRLAERFPAVGMPLALPGLEPAELATLRDWIAAGAPGPSPAARAARDALTPAEQATLDAWEEFFNPRDPTRAAKAALVSRYLYEHVFLARMALGGVPGKFFELVRSRTPAPAPVEEIVTETPLDAPGTGPVYYRLKPDPTLPAQKSHFVWSLDATERARLEELFYAADWGPGPIEPAGYRTSNPFINFARVPARARSRFMLEHSRLMVNGMIRGPVCVGNTATYAIRDQFWVFFAQPETDPTVLDPTLGLAGADREVLLAKDPAGKARFRERLEATIRRLRPHGFSLDDVWNGEGRNHGAVLTVLRHQTSATVLEGARGEFPRTLWFVNYAGFERLYYDLVAQYRYWGGVAHAFTTWSFMSTLREGFEDEFLAFLPTTVRRHVRDEWTQGLGRAALQLVPHSFLPGQRETQLSDIDPARPVADLVGRLRRRLGSRVMPEDPIHDAEPATNWERGLRALAEESEGRFPRYLPEVMHVLLRDGGETRPYSLLVNRWFRFNNLALAQSNARDPAKDTFMALRGIVGDFPELFVDLDVAQAPEFLRELRALDSDAAFGRFQARWGILRNSAKFWPFLEELQRYNAAEQGREAGALDLMRYRGY
jgi:hypothetical protein